ncbi:hypothetical protein [Thermocladium modestius]|nr:hypothetical protein [Thermocladium modestius]
MNNRIRAIVLAICLMVSLGLLYVSAIKSNIILISNVEALNLQDSAIGILSTLNVFYLIGFVVLAVSVLLTINMLMLRSRLLSLLLIFIILIYLVGYPLLLSPYPPYLADGTSFSAESSMISLFGYSSVRPMLYNNGFYPLALIWEAMLGKVTGLQPIRLSSIYGFLEPIFLILVAYLVSRRLYEGEDSIHIALLSMLIYIALIWSYQFHFSPQDFNIVLFMLLIPLFPMITGGDSKAIGLLSLAAVTLTLTHQTEMPILIASLAALLLLRLVRRARYWPIALNMLTVSSAMFMAYSIYAFMGNIEIISGVFSPSAIERLITLLLGRVSHAVFFEESLQSVYPLRLMVYRLELHGGYAMAVFELIASISIYLWLLLRGGDKFREAYASVMVGGLVVIALVTIALGSYGNRVVIYTAPILSGFLGAYLWRIVKRWRNIIYFIIPILMILGFMGLIFSSSTIYWDYSAGNPVTWVSFRLMYGLGYHCNLATYYNTNWLTGYELLKLTHSINNPCTYQLFDFNKDDLLYLANDVNLESFRNALSSILNSSIIYNDGLNLVSTGP